MSENGEIYNAGNNFTLPPAVTALANSTSALLKDALCFYIIAVFHRFCLDCGKRTPWLHA